MNDYSSRSHLIFSIIVQTFNTNTNQRTTAKISFVDLAGSEKVKKSNPTVEQLKETTSINQSLSSLREVIKTLAQGDPN